MNENVENLILVQLREIRGEMSAMRPDLSRMEGDVKGLRGEVRDGFDSVNARVDGVATLLTLLAGHVHHIDERVEKLEGRFAQ